MIARPIFGALVAAPVVVAVWLVLATVAQAQARPVACAPAPALIERLAERYGEAVAFSGLRAGGGQMLQVLFNPETGTWTVLALRPDGIACLAAEGEAGRIHAAAPAGEGL